MSALPTVLISSIGVVEDTTICTTQNFKNNGDLIFALGETKPEMGGSEYFNMIGYSGGFVPQLNAIQSIKNYQIFHELLKNYLIESSISINNGGLINAINRSGMNCGAKINLDNLNHSCNNIEQILFSESCGRILFSIKKDNEKRLLEFFEENEFTCYAKIGEVSDDKIMSLQYQKEKISYSCDELKNAYRTNYFKII